MQRSVSIPSMPTAHTEALFLEMAHPFSVAAPFAQGIVSIPGMMTGQILGGSDPAVAARYQIIVMFLIGAATGLSSGASVCAAIMVCSQQGVAMLSPACMRCAAALCQAKLRLPGTLHCPPTVQQQISLRCLTPLPCSGHHPAGGPVFD